jgi:hypothetical protein
MSERDTERGRVGRQPVGDGERSELACHREADDRHLRSRDQLLDERRARPRRVSRRGDRLRDLVRVEHEREALLALSVGRLDDQRRLQRQLAVRDDLPARLGHSGLRESLSLAELVCRERRRCGRDWMRQAELRGHARRNGDRPVGARGDHSVGRERRREPLDRRLVLGRDDATAVGERKPGRRGVAVDDRRPDAVRPRSFEQPELRRTCA